MAIEPVSVGARARIERPTSTAGSRPGTAAHSPPVLARCENCGGDTTFAPLFGQELETWRCQRCDSWSYLGPIEKRAEQLIGCATGTFLQLLRARGVRELVGVEVSEYARAQARNDGFEVLAPGAAELESRLRELRPNLIVAWDVPVVARRRA
jgi:hypothetical protein